jgi:putative oxidoreductase
VALAERPGKASVDAAFGRARWGAGWAIFALIAGVLGSVVAVEAGKRLAPQEHAESDVEQPEASAEG